MTCGAARESFQDMIAKVVFEHDRVRAENLQLQHAIAGLQANEPASTPLQASEPASTPLPMGAAVPVATVPAVPKESPNPLWAPEIARLPLASAFPVAEATLPASNPPQEAPWWLSDTSAPQVVASPRTQSPCTRATAFMPYRFTQSAGALGVQSRTQAGDDSQDDSLHTRRWSLHAVESGPVQDAIVAHTSASSRSSKLKARNRFDPARAESRFSFSTTVPRNYGRFTVQRSPSLDESEQQVASKDAVHSFALPASLKKIFSEWPCVVSLRKFVRALAFNLFFAVAVVAYALFIGYEAACFARNPRRQSRDIDIAHAVFNLIFLVEVILRFSADCLRFFFGEAWRWNILDLGLVLTSGIDFFILRRYVHVSHSGGIRTVRFARILRLMRTIRILRTIRSVHELHKMMYSFLSSMRTLLCASLVLAFVMYLFSILFTVASAEQRSTNPAAVGPLQKFYGTLGRTFKSLFWAISNGVSWSTMYEPIADIHWAYGFCFFMYIIIVMFGVLNVVTSVFVESAFLSAQYYKELIVKDKEMEKAVASGHIMAVFRQMDQNWSGEITSEAMEFFLQDQGLRQYLEALDLSADDTRMLFRLLDQDSSGVIDMDEFCTGCLKLKGEAKSIDVHILMLQMHRFLKKWSDFTEYVEDQFTNVERELSFLLKGQGKTSGDI